MTSSPVSIPLSGPPLNVGPVPCRSATDHPARLGHYATSPPHVDSRPSHAETLGDLSNAHRVAVPHPATVAKVLTVDQGCSDNQYMTAEQRDGFVPYSQVWSGSCGGQAGNVHLHVPCPVEYERRQPTVLTATAGRRTTITRQPGVTLCGKARGWMEREPDPDEMKDRCPRCEAMAGRYDVEWPT